MGQPATDATSAAPTRDHGFHTARIARVIHETDDAATFVIDVRPELADAFRYDAGQFCTFRVWTDGRPLLRCYSMSSAPAVDDELRVTVKRVPGGTVSNWMNDELAPGDEIEVTRPAGVFCLDGTNVDIVAIAAGSGITPVISLVKEALATSPRRIHLLYANRDRDSVIFGAELDDLVARHPDRLSVRHHLDVDAGFIDHDGLTGFLDAVDPATATAYVCGPPDFMDLAEAALVGAGFDPPRIRIERFTPTTDEPAATTTAEATDAVATTVTIELDGRTESTEHRAGTTILQVARQVGLNPPYSCESGSCATCMARLLDGTVQMHANNALTDDEVDEGWILTCQSVPTSASVRVVYGFD